MRLISNITLNPQLAVVAHKYVLGAQISILSLLHRCWVGVAGKQLCLLGIHSLETGKFQMG